MQCEFAWHMDGRSISYRTVSRHISNHLLFHLCTSIRQWNDTRIRFRCACRTVWDMWAPMWLILSEVGLNFLFIQSRFDLSVQEPQIQYSLAAGYWCSLFNESVIALSFGVVALARMFFTCMLFRGCWFSLRSYQKRKLRSWMLWFNQLRNSSLRSVSDILCYFTFLGQVPKWTESPRSFWIFKIHIVLMLVFFFFLLLFFVFQFPDAFKWIQCMHNTCTYNHKTDIDQNSLLHLQWILSQLMSMLKSQMKC